MDDIAVKPEATAIAPAAAAGPAVAPKPIAAKPADVATAPKAPVAVKPATAKPAAAKPVVAKPVVAKPAAAKPVIARKRAEAKPLKRAVLKPAPKRNVAGRAKPIATKTIATKTIAAKDFTMDSVKTITDKAQAMFSTDHAKGAIEKGQKMFDEMNSFSKGNLEAIVESSKIAAKGFESLGQDAAAYAKKSFEEATAAAKTLASVKSPTEFMKLQSDYVRSAFDMMVAETSRSTEAMLKLAGEVAQPISNRVALAAEKVKIAA